MPRKNFLQRAREKGAAGKPACATGERHLNDIQPAVEERYQKILDDWEL
jgi:hypothetical protein